MLARRSGTVALAGAGSRSYGSPVDRAERHAVAESWAAQHAPLTGAPRVFQERPWATVWTAETRDGIVWLKACGPAQAFEARLTATLARRQTDLLPRVIAADGGRALLLLADAGPPLGFDAGFEPWLEILPRYAELQRMETAAPHLAAGVPDRRLDVLPAAYADALERDLPLSTRERSRLAAFAATFGGLCHELADAGPAPTVQHDDLHGNNVYVRDAAGRILDWGDACVSHPFLTMFVTLVHLPNAGVNGPSRAMTERVVDAYLEPWGSLPDRREAMGIVLRIGPFAHLFKELRVHDAVPPSESRFAPDLRAILRQCLAAVP
jgi:hypothetical protein